MLGGGAMPGAIIMDIVGVHAVSNCGESARARQRRQFPKQFILAMEAAVRRVGDVSRIIKLRRANNLQRNIKLAGKPDRMLALRLGETRRISQHREHPLAQRPPRRPRQVSRIHPAGVRHQSGLQGHESSSHHFSFTHEFVAHQFHSRTVAVSTFI